MTVLYVETFEQWREAARNCLQEGFPPDSVQWSETKPLQTSFFGLCTHLPTPQLSLMPAATPQGSKAFLALAQRVACHRDSIKWSLLYQALWRMNQGEKHLLHLKTDALVQKLGLMFKSVSRDAHKMKAFVRFRRCIQDEKEHYIAWHRPDHYVVSVTAPFFQRRFNVMRWTILTPDCSVHWDGSALQWGEGVAEPETLAEDKAEKIWLAYYRATFNPARIKLKAMRREMPVRHWATLPETALIPLMLAEAPGRVQKMMEIAMHPTFSK